ncbi:MAG: hemolysin III family protein [Clostridiales bacterium]|nr:hemolysin III family protein [Clostridiales bacterium]
MAYTNNFRLKDPGSAITHFIGFVAALVAGFFLIMHAITDNGSAKTIASCSVFIASACLLYAASTCYHSFNVSEKANLRFKKVDHMMIPVLIAGTYTPVCLLGLQGRLGVILLIVVWSIAILSMIFKLFWVTCPRWISSVLYIGMGWSCVFAIPTLFRTLPLAGFMWLLVGGILYTVGGVIYALKLKVFNNLCPNFGSHEIFHVFVMAGTLCHFNLIYFYLV